MDKNKRYCYPRVEFSNAASNIFRIYKFDYSWYIRRLYRKNFFKLYR